MTNRPIRSILSDRRRDLGMTQMELADLLDVRQCDVARWECGRAPLPPLPNLERLSAILGLSIASLIPGSCEPDVRLIQLSPQEADQVV